MFIADDENSQKSLLHELTSHTGVAITQGGELVSAVELSYMDLSTIVAATDNFSDSHKLKKGDFGVVYKLTPTFLFLCCIKIASYGLNLCMVLDIYSSQGLLPDGKEVAVKRLSRKSWQSLNELKNEVILITKCKHQNHVKLLGCGIEGEEKLLVYEFMPNRSLDVFIFGLFFDPSSLLTFLST
jgi:serine/threonine protein kinase